MASHPHAVEERAGPWGASGCWRSSGPIRMIPLDGFSRQRPGTGGWAVRLHVLLLPPQSQPCDTAQPSARCPSSLTYSPHRIVSALNEVILIPISHSICSPRSSDSSQLYFFFNVSIISSEAGHMTFKKYIVITDHVKFFCAETL